MTDEPTRRRFTRRQALAMGAGGLAALGAGPLLSAAARVAAPRSLALPAAPTTQLKMRLVTTDGFISLPGRPIDPATSEPALLYVFGFVEAPLSWKMSRLVRDKKGKVRVPSPIIYMDKDDTDVFLTASNVGFLKRPDLDDAHTIHWHGFPNALAAFDGVPEVSFAVPPNRDLTYFYRPHREGTFMYHCHFEDVEHVQMGMDGVIFVRPTQNTNTQKYAYDDVDGSTAYDREFTLLLNEIDPRPHDGLLAVQEFHWTEYDPTFWVINGRCYPDTVEPSITIPISANPDTYIDDSNPLYRLRYQPVSSLVQANGDERVLLRFVNLGYQQHAMHVPGLRLTIVGEDATLLRGPGGLDLSYDTNVVYIGPGESRDALFTTPLYDQDLPVLNNGDGNGNYNRYMLLNRNYQTLNNNGESGLGGMATEIRVYSSPLPNQNAPNETYPAFP